MRYGLFFHGRGEECVGKTLILTTCQIKSLPAINQQNILYVI